MPSSFLFLLDSFRGKEGEEEKRPPNFRGEKRERWARFFPVPPKEKKCVLYLDSKKRKGKHNRRKKKKGILARRGVALYRPGDTRGKSKREGSGQGAFTNS